jgi:hypothetical protein
MRAPLLLMFILLALVACQRDEVEEPDIIVSVEPEFIVDLYEQRDTLGAQPRFGFWIESVAKYACPGYQIRTTTKLENNHLFVQILEVEKPLVCVGDSSPARQFVPLGALSAGSYNMTVTLGEAEALVSEGTLKVESNVYELSMSETRGFDLQNRVLNVLPAKCLWGYVLTPQEIQTPPAYQFLTDLKTLTDEPVLAPGFYGYFTVSGSGQYFFHRSIAPPAGQNVPFLRKLTASEAALQSLLQGYRSDADQPLAIRCWSSEGPY